MFVARILSPVHSLGPGKRVCLWTQGCKKRCKRCMSPELQPFTGTETEEELLSKLLNKLAEKNDCKGITISGGEPFEQPQALLKLLKLLRNNFEDVLDIGTGSGCIACTIAKQTKATVLGVDISSDALRVALDNVTKLGINNRAIFRKSNLFEKIREGESFDIILSNPPYIPIGTELSQEVMSEPSLALFAEENGLKFYRQIIEQAPDFLNEGGYLMFELGIDQADSVNEFMKKDFNNILIIKDLAGIERVILGQKKA